jgi:hypothetical protein
MKKILFICSMTLLHASLHAQAKAPLDKFSTEQYLRRKIKEIEGHYRTPVGSSERLYFIEASSLLFSNNSLEISTKRKNKIESRAYNCSYHEYENTVVFNPKDIMDIQFEGKNADDPVGILKIIFNAQVCKETLAVYGYKTKLSSGYCDDWIQSGRDVFSKKEILIPFLVSDETNFSKIKKAFEHLRDLCKADDDPFGN